MRNLLVVVVFAVLGGVAGRVSWDALTVRAPYDMGPWVSPRYQQGSLLGYVSEVPARGSSH
jgi:hypothetical protein